MKRLLYLLGRIVVEELRERLRLLFGDVKRYIPHSRRVPYRTYEACEKRLYVPTWTPGEPRPGGGWVGWKLYQSCESRRDRPATQRECKLIRIR